MVSYWFVYGLSTRSKMVKGTFSVTDVCPVPLKNFPSGHSENFRRILGGSRRDVLFILGLGRNSRPRVGAQESFRKGLLGYLSSCTGDGGTGGGEGSRHLAQL